VSWADLELMSRPDIIDMNEYLDAIEEFEQDEHDRLERERLQRTNPRRR
jgi:hypothetical protein